MESLGGSVSRLESSEFKRASGILARAFYDDPVVQSILRGLEPQERISRLELVFGLTLNAIGSKGMLLGVKKEDRLSGVALLHPPNTYPLPLLRQFYVLLKGVMRKGFYGLGRWIEWKRSIQARHPKEGHYYLELIGVEPSLQRKGLGSSLMTEIVNLADQQKLPCYLETSNPMNLPFYDRFGFRIFGEEKIIGVLTWFMRRPHRLGRGEGLC